MRHTQAILDELALVREELAKYELACSGWMDCVEEIVTGLTSVAERQAGVITRVIAAVPDTVHRRTTTHINTVERL